jgi:hypothetical protein
MGAVDLIAIATLVGERNLSWRPGPGLDKTTSYV